MDLGISWPAVVVAIVVGMATAWVWYSDWGLAGGVWRRLTGVTREASAAGGKSPFAILLVSIMVTALALAAAWSMASVVVGSRSVWLALAVAFSGWLGFSLSTLAQHNGFEQKPARLTVVNGAYQLVLFLGMGLVIGLIG